MTVRRPGWSRGEPTDLLLAREWLVTNGLGGFASATVATTLSRRYHGLLVSAMPAGRVVALSRLDEDLLLDGRRLRLGGTVRDGVPEPSTDVDAVDFRLEHGLPVWTMQTGGCVVRRRVLMPHEQNTVHIDYTLLDGVSAVVQLRPLLQRRRLEDAVSTPLRVPSWHQLGMDRCEVAPGEDLPAIQLHVAGGAFSTDVRTERQWYALEAERGYEPTGELWSPGVFEVTLNRGDTVTLFASTEAWPACTAPAPGDALAAELSRREVLLAGAAPSLREGAGAELVLAADQFIVTPTGRVDDAARARAEGDEARTIIAGYHWFTDWGRDTMISLEGLTLATGRAREAGAILRMFARHVRRGLIPNLFPEGEAGGTYNTADASLWLFHALHRYVQTTRDRAILRDLLPHLRDIVAAHLAGTDFNIGVDPSDGLLRQGAPGCALTWMDAKVGDWVVTPRRGKAVELQGLWYNALRLLQRWSSEEGEPADATAYAEHADRARDSFNKRFWHERAGHLFDVIDGEDGDDASLRPNQLLAFSLEHPVLDQQRWPAVLQVVTDRLLTPVGVRSLSPASREYHARYDGDRRARDAAYHQGTVWPWLIGPYVSAWRRVHGPDADAMPLLVGLLGDLGDGCIGQISEICDAEPPFQPRGCVAQAWSVTELLRCLATEGAAGAGDAGRSASAGDHDSAMR